MLGELSVGHLYVAGGAVPDVKSRTRSACSAPTTRSRTTAIDSPALYDGENWNPNLRAPLTQPGVNVKAGEYLLAVNGELQASDNVYPGS